MSTVKVLLFYLKIDKILSFYCCLSSIFTDFFLSSFSLFFSPLLLLSFFFFVSSKPTSAHL